MKVLFRADASQKIGGGHVMRSLVIAEEFHKRGHECFFVAQTGSFDMTPFNNSAGVQTFARIELDEKKLSDVNALESLLPQGFKPDLSFVDSYLLNADYEKCLCDFSKKVATLDDMPTRKHWAHFLIDPTFSRRPIEYKELLPEKSSILTGVRFAPLREEFARLRPKSLARRGKSKTAARPRRHIVLSMGLSDPDNVTSTILYALQKIDIPLDVTVVIGKDSPFQPEISQLCQSLKTPAQILIAHENMAGLLSECDLVIGAGGSSSWERCCLGVPALQVILSQNQEDVTNNLAKVGAIYSLGQVEKLSPDMVADALSKHLSEDLLLVGMSQSAALLCDGLGASRIVDHIETMR